MLVDLVDELYVRALSSGKVQMGFESGASYSVPAYKSIRRAGLCSTHESLVFVERSCIQKRRAFLHTKAYVELVCEGAGRAGDSMFRALCLTK